MSSKLDRLLDAIAPERTLDAVGARVAAAMNSFRAQPQGVESWQREDLYKYLGLFFQHMEEVALIGKPVGLEPEEHLQMHNPLLEQEYGAQWHRVVLMQVRTGVNGGLYAVLRAMARRLVTKWAEARIGWHIFDYWKGLTEEEQQQAPREYLSKYGPLLPAEVKEHWYLTIWFLFPKFLEQHPYIMQRAHRVGR